MYKTFLYTEMVYLGQVINICAFDEVDMEKRKQEVIKSIETNFLQKLMDNYKETWFYYAAVKYGIEFCFSGAFELYTDMDNLRWHTVFREKPIYNAL